MNHISDFFQGWFWAAITGVVTLLSATVPAVLYLSRKLKPVRASIGLPAPRTQTLKRGCRDIFTATAVNVSTLIVYFILVSGIWAVVSIAAPAQIRAQINTFEGTIVDFIGLMCSGCALLVIELTIYLLITVYSVFLSLRRGYEYGVFAVLIGMNVVAFPLSVFRFFLATKNSPGHSCPR